MIKNILKNKKIICLILLLIPIFKPIGLTYYTSINNIFQILKIISLFIMIFSIIKDIKGNEKKKYFYIIYLGVFWIIYIINSFIYRGNYLDILNNAITSVVLLIFIKKEFDYDKGNLFKAFKFIFNSYLILHILSVGIINTIHIGIFDSESGTTYFLGKDNYSAFITIPMVTISLFINYVEKREISWNYVIMLFILTLCYALTQSYTALLALSCFSVFIILLKFKVNLLKYISIRKTIILVIVLLFLISIFNIQNVFEYFLNNIGKGITLNSRTIIWKDAIELIKEKPLLGYGDLSIDKINDYYLYGASHAHNFVLELLLRTGIIGTICYMLFLDKSVKYIYKREKTDMKISILILGVISYILISFMDFYPILQYQYCLFGILYCYSEKVNKEEKI